ncbi:MAG: TIGR03067 domain-containing protein [Cellvibrio sp.]|uniref:TIGR03067 domain-containing protein n=1 Tax=Cellvibrio sp. TaxID=1965322 RepID=UPI00271FF833|nr:TIGR03067 domain-containing protein [Cellvibrio sp.]
MNDDLKLLQGRWIQIKCNSDGVDNPLDEFKHNPELEISENTFSVFASSGELIIAGVFKINPMAHPPSIDWTDTYGTDKGKTFPSIYTLSENKLVFCAANDDMERPGTYEPGYGYTIRYFERK